MVHLQHLRPDDDKAGNDESSACPKRSSKSGIVSAHSRKKKKEALKATSKFGKGVSQGTENPKCPYCDYRPNRTTSLECLIQHINAKHLGVKDHACPLCLFKTSFRASLTQHFQSVHLLQRLEKFKCSYCNYCVTQASKYRLREHINAKHLGIKDQECSQCDFKTGYRHILKSHVKAKHSMIKNFACSHCEFRTSFKQSLTRHVRGQHSKKKAARPIRKLCRTRRK